MAKSAKPKISSKQLNIAKEAMRPFNNGIIVTESDDELNMAVTSGIELAAFISLWSHACKLMYRSLSPEFKQEVTYMQYIRLISNRLAQGYDIQGEKITADEIALEQQQVFGDINAAAKKAKAADNKRKKAIKKGLEK